MKNRIRKSIIPTFLVAITLITGLIVLFSLFILLLFSIFCFFVLFKHMTVINYKK
ncbi:hypothetical protein EGLA_13540 [Enterococcus gallinarum]|nr:hypothetical protein AH4_34960 [Enterococcus gallinarum]